jgi:hypothetical protein
MKPNKVKMRGRGISSVLTAVIMALAIIAVIAFIVISWPMIKSGFDKNYWSGSMSLYRLNFVNSTYAYTQTNVGGSLSSNPSPIGYCIAYGNNSTNATYTCPSNLPSYQNS